MLNLRISTDLNRSVQLFLAWFQVLLTCSLMRVFSLTANRTHQIWKRAARIWRLTSRQVIKRKDWKTCRTCSSTAPVSHSTASTQWGTLPHFPLKAMVSEYLSLLGTFYTIWDTYTQTSRVSSIQLRVILVNGMTSEITWETSLWDFSTVDMCQDQPKQIEILIIYLP